MSRAFTFVYNGKVNTLRTSCLIATNNGVVECNAIWDTGATSSMISNRLIPILNPPIVGAKTAHTANGKVETNTYSISIKLPNNVIYSDLIVGSGTISGADILIGMDIISNGDFAITTSNDKTLFSFQTPSTHSIDFRKDPQNQIIELKEKAEQITKKPKVGRNDPCPCGSGLKYKKCCGNH